MLNCLLMILPLFSVVQDINESPIELNGDLKKLMIGAFNGK